MHKRIMMLGGSFFQLAPIVYAKDKGYYVIICDYLPNNPGRMLSDEYHNVSTTNKKDILKLAKKLNIDAVIAYASDPAAPTAAYVAEALGLPGNPYESVLTLCHKDLYRNFQHENGFNAPWSKSFYNLEEAKHYLEDKGPVCMVKPVDSSGSKGVKRVTTTNELDLAFNTAMSFSRANRVLLEEYVIRKGYQIAGDGFIVDGRLVFSDFANEHFNTGCNPMAPVGESFPLHEGDELKNNVHNETQRLIDLLGLTSGAINFDVFIDNNQNVHLMEIGPRNGGNLIPEVIKLHTDVDLVACTVEAALGMDCPQLTSEKCSGYFSSYMLHAERDGALQEIIFSENIKRNIIKINIFKKKDEIVSKFDGSHCTLGTVLFRFDHEDEMLSKMDYMSSYIRVNVM